MNRNVRRDQLQHREWLIKEISFKNCKEYLNYDIYRDIFKIHQFTYYSLSLISIFYYSVISYFYSISSSSYIGSLFYQSYYSIISYCSYSAAAYSSSTKRVGSYWNNYLPVLSCPFVLFFFYYYIFFFWRSAYFLILLSSFHFMKTSNVTRGPS